MCPGVQGVQRFAWMLPGSVFPGFKGVEPLHCLGTLWALGQPAWALRRGRAQVGVRACALAHASVSLTHVPTK